MGALTSSEKAAVPQTAPVMPSESCCRRCGAPLRRIQSLLDLKTGHTVRLLVYMCGEALWPDDLQD